MSLNPFSQRVVLIIKSIPEGQVASYGQIAAMAGNHRAARQVSRILHSCTKKYELPWHRVVNSQGKISLDNKAFDLQYQLLKSEAVEFGLNGQIDIKKYGFKG